MRNFFGEPDKNDKNRRMRNKGSADKTPMTIADVLKAIDGEDYPPYMENLLKQISSWLNMAVTQDFCGQDVEDSFWGYEDDDHKETSLLEKLSWAGEHASIIPSEKTPPPMREAVILSIGPIFFDEGLRMAMDQAAIFAQGICKRVWLLCDTWSTAEIAAHREHLIALNLQGIELRFILVTPWGWTEIPVSAQKEIKEMKWR